MNPRRRSLVLTNEAARHPFRAGLPPPAALPRRTRLLGAPRFDAGDARDFAMAFVATFLVVSAFIA